MAADVFSNAVSGTASAGTPLRVAFNATPVLSTVTGIGNYIVELGRALALLPDVQPFSFYRHRWRPGSPEPPIAASGTAARGIAERVKPWVPFRVPLRHVARYMGFAQGLRRYGIELYHEQNYVPLSYAVPVVITIHDLSWIRYPEAHPVDRVRWLERGVPRAIDRAAAVLVDSDFIRDEVLTTFGVDTELVHTAHLGVSGLFRPRGEEETRGALAGFGLTHGRYMLTVGTIEPRKNLTHMLESFSRLPPDLRERYPLVVAGAKGWHSGEIRGELRRRADPHVCFLGHVDAHLLPSLYAGCALFAYPSLYEGFGLPPLEAMASGVPVIVSHRASLPEVVGDAGETMDPLDPAATAETVHRLLEDEPARARLARLGLARASNFTWAACASVTRSVYRFALGKGSCVGDSPYRATSGGTSAQ